MNDKEKAAQVWQEINEHGYERNASKAFIEAALVKARIEGWNGGVRESSYLFHSMLERNQILRLLRPEVEKGSDPDGEAAHLMGKAKPVGVPSAQGEGSGTVRDKGSEP